MRFRLCRPDGHGKTKDSSFILNAPIVPLCRISAQTVDRISPEAAAEWKPADAGGAREGHKLRAMGRDSQLTDFHWPLGVELSLGRLPIRCLKVNHMVCRRCNLLGPKQHRLLILSSHLLPRENERGGDREQNGGAEQQTDLARQG